MHIAIITPLFPKFFTIKDLKRIESLGEKFSESQLIKKVFKEIALICLGFSVYQTIFLGISLSFPEELGLSNRYLTTMHIWVFILIDFGIFNFYYFKRRSYMISRWGKDWESRDGLKKFGNDFASVISNPLIYSLIEILIVYSPEFLYNTNELNRRIFLLCIWSMVLISYLVVIIYDIIFRRRKYLD